MTAAALLQAIGLFIATNIDDIIVLSLFFARGAGRPGTTAKILAGQYLGFVGILAAALVVTLGAGWALPEEAIPYFGLIPLALGLWAAWEVYRGEGDDDDAAVSGKSVAVATVAGVTFAKQYGLTPGIALSAAQMAQLTSDIVWLVEQTVTLPDGSSQRVLVPPWAGVRNSGVERPAPRSSPKRSVTSPAHSMPVPDSSPSPCAACRSPTENRAPATSTGSQSVLPATSCRMSMLPPTCRGGAVGCGPRAAGATPSTPGKGASGTRMPITASVVE